MTLGEQIQALRKEAGLSQEGLGEKLGVARQSVSKWESDMAIPELDKLIAMSKLFGVTIGSLLGLEEGEAPDHELTDRELAALEAIAQRITPPQAEPKKRKRWPYVLTAVVVLGAGMFLMSRINNLENQIGSLHYNISNIDNTVSRQISSLTGQVREILEEQNRVTAGQSYTITDTDLGAGTVTFRLSATPREYREGMEAVFTAAGPDFETVEVPGVLEAGQTFTAELVCPLTDDITVSVGFVTGEGTTVSQQLGQEHYLWSDTMVSVHGTLGWSTMGWGEETRLISLVANVWMGGPAGYKTEKGYQEITVVQGTLRLWKGEELFWSQECEELGEYASFPVPISTENLQLGPGERLILSVLYTDSAGRTEEIFLDGLQMDEEWILVQKRSNEAGEAWELPWER